MNQNMLDSDAEYLERTPKVSQWRTVALELCFVFSGGLLGTGARSFLLLIVGPHLDSSIGGWPLDLLIVNVSGAFLIGILAGWRDPLSRAHEMIWLTFATGFLGAYTTFSSLALDLAQWERQGRLLLAGVYLGGSVVLGFVAVEMGLWIGAQLHQRQ